MIGKLPFGVLTPFLAASVAASVTNSTKVPLPSVLGSYKVDVSNAELIDYSRSDPYAPTPQPRKLMVSVFTPMSSSAHCQKDAFTPYMPAGVASYEDSTFAAYGVPNGSFFRPELRVCHRDGAHNDDGCGDNFPLVLFSPGLGLTRLLYSAMVQAVASAGYVVIALDHPYDADIIEYPDGTLLQGTFNPTTEAELDQGVAVRTADALFVLDLVLDHPARARAALPGLPPLALGPDPRRPRAGIFGHSFGGATAGLAMLRDARLVGGVNLDGGMYGPVVSEGLDRPFFLFARDGHNQTSDATWAELWPQLRGWKAQLSLKGGMHGTFSDLLLLIKVLGIDQELAPGVVAPLLGTIDGDRALFVIYSYITAFLDFVLKGGKDTLFERPSKQFPEMLFTNISTKET